MQALFIESAFAGDDEVGGDDAGFESDLCRDHVEAADETSAQESHESEAESTRGAGTRYFAWIVAEVASHEVGEVCEPLFEPDEIRDAFLWAVDARGAAGAEQGIVHIAGDDELEGGQGGWLLDLIGLQNRLQGGGEGVPRLLEGISKGDGHPEAAIVGGASSDADEDAARAFGEGGLDEDSCT